MFERSVIFTKLEERPQDWDISRTTQIYTPSSTGPSLAKRFSVAMGKMLIKIGEKLVYETPKMAQETL